MLWAGRGCTTSMERRQQRGWISEASTVQTDFLYASLFPTLALQSPIASIHKKLEHPRNPEVRAASGSRQKCLHRICETISVNTGDTLPDAGHPLGSVRDPQALQALRRDVQQDRVLGRYPASCNEASFSWVDVKAKS